MHFDKLNNKSLEGDNGKCHVQEYNIVSVMLAMHAGILYSQ